MRRSRRLALLLLVAGALAVAGCAEHVSPAALAAQIEAGTPPLIVDVRSLGEYETSHVPGARHVPFYAMLSAADELPARSAADPPLVLYCEHGPRAGIARAQLWLAGVGPVLLLEGHMKAWKEGGFPVESERAPGG
jgi:rhodanese-related sulfurtransferase